MPLLKVERIEHTYDLAAGASPPDTLGPGTTNVHILIPKRISAGVTDRTKRVIFASVRVITAANGTGTLSMGTTTGGTTALMTTGDIGLGTAGRKLTASGADLAGNSVARSPGAADEFLTLTYTRGSDSNTPRVQIVVVLVEGDVVDDLLVA